MAGTSFPAATTRRCVCGACRPRPRARADPRRPKGEEITPPATTDDFLDLVRRSNQIEIARLQDFVTAHRAGDGLPTEPRKLAALMVREGLLTNFQAEQLLQGKWRGFA